MREPTGELSSFQEGEGSANDVVVASLRQELAIIITTASRWTGFA